MRSPLHAPAVRYPYGRSRSVGRVLAAVACAGFTCLAAWLIAGAGNATTVKAVVGAGLWSLCAAWAWHVWRNAPVGWLVWDGREWALESDASTQGCSPCRGPRIHLDLQVGMLLSVRLQHGGIVWLWLERRSDAPQWTALRRAVYSPAHAERPDLAVAETTDEMPSQRDGGVQNKT